MSDSVQYLVILISLLACFALGISINKSMRQLKSHKRAGEQQKRNSEERRKYLSDSMRILASSILDQQVELSEACIRIKVLMDHYDVTLHQRADLNVFTEVYDLLSHMPTFDERKLVKKRLLAKLDADRFNIEEKYKDDVTKACTCLLVELAKNTS